MNFKSNHIHIDEAKKFYKKKEKSNKNELKHSTLHRSNQKTDKDGVLAGIEKRKQEESDQIGSDRIQADRENEGRKERGQLTWIMKWGRKDFPLWMDQNRNLEGQGKLKQRNAERAFKYRQANTFEMSVARTRGWGELSLIRLLASQGYIRNNIIKKWLFCLRNSNC